MACCGRGPGRGPCALHLAEGNSDHSTLLAPGHVLTCVPNTDHQKIVGAFGRAVLEAHLDNLRSTQ